MQIFKAYLKFIISLIPIIILFAIAEYLITYKYNTFVEKKDLLEKKLNDIEIFLVGDSRSFGISPHYFNLTAFNLGFAWQDINFDYLLTTKYLDRMPRLKYVIFSISDYSLYNKICGNNSAKVNSIMYNIIYDLGKCDENENILSITNYSVIANVGFNYLFLNLKLMNLLDSLGGLKYEENANQIVNSGRDEKSMFLSGKKRAKDLYQNCNLEFLSENLYLITRMVKLLERKNIEFVILIPPAAGYYRSFIDYAMYEKGISKLDEIEKESSNLKIINLFESKKFDASDFTDADHLNSKGYIKLSKMINNLIIE